MSNLEYMCDGDEQLKRMNEWMKEDGGKVRSQWKWNMQSVYLTYLHHRTLKLNNQAASNVSLLLLLVVVVLWGDEHLTKPK